MQVHKWSSAKAVCVGTGTGPLKIYINESTSQSAVALIDHPDPSLIRSVDPSHGGVTAGGRELRSHSWCTDGEREFS